MEELFRKMVPVSVKHSGKEDNVAQICLCIYMNVTSSPIHKKELLVRLTDEQDPFFLYTLAIEEQDYQQLKTQQGLLVDFSAFPQKFIDLIQTCLVEAEQQSPKFLLQLVVSADKSPCVLNIIETNPFRHLNHLSLKFIPASDSFLKKYLAECLICLKEENGKLSDMLAATKTDLSAQLAHSESVLASKTKELDKLKSDWSAHTTSLISEHSARITAEKEKAIQLQAEAERRLSQERRDIEQAHTVKIRSLEERLSNLDSSNQELTDHKYRSEAAIRELKAKLRGNDEELSSTRQELSDVRRENGALDAAYHKLEKESNQIRTRVAVLEQELHDKEQVIEQTSQLLEAAKEQKHSVELLLDQQQRQVTKLDIAFREASHEVTKGNEIIQKLQTEVKNMKSKIKMKNLVTTQQEKVLADKEGELERMKTTLSSLKERLVGREEEMAKMEKMNGSLQKELEESKEMLRTNENVISWLNKQMNDHALSGRGVELPSSIRLPHPSVFTGGAGSGMHRPQFSSTPTLSSIRHSAPSGGEGGVIRPVFNPLTSQENIPRQQVVFRGPVKIGHSHTPSPLTAHNRSAPTINTTTTTTPTTHNPRSKSNPSSPGDVSGPVIDPRYLLPCTTPAECSVTPGVVRGAPLASTYFPN